MLGQGGIGIVLISRFFTEKCDQLGQQGLPIDLLLIGYDMSPTVSRLSIVKNVNRMSKSVQVMALLSHHQGCHLWNQSFAALPYVKDDLSASLVRELC